MKQLLVFLIIFCPFSLKADFLLRVTNVDASSQVAIKVFNEDGVIQESTKPDANGDKIVEFSIEDNADKTPLAICITKFSDGIGVTYYITKFNEITIAENDIILPPSFSPVDAAHQVISVIDIQEIVNVNPEYSQGQQFVVSNGDADESGLQFFNGQSYTSTDIPDSSDSIHFYSGLIEIVSFDEVIGGGIDELIPGCTNPCAINYDPTATEDDGSCDFEIMDDGCDITDDLFDEVTCITVHIPNCPDDAAFDSVSCSCENSFTCPEDIIISSSEIFCGTPMNVVNHPTYTVISINGEDSQLINNSINVTVENDSTQLIKDEAENMLNDFINTIKLCIQKAKQLTDEAKQLIECAKKLEQEANEFDKAAKRAEQDAKEDFEDSVAIMSAGILAAAAAALAGGIPGWIAAGVALATAATFSAQAAERGAEHKKEAKDLRKKAKEKRDKAKEKMKEAEELHVLVEKEIKKIEKMLEELEMLYQPLIANNEFDIENLINNLNLNNQHLNQRKQLFNNIDSTSVAIYIITDSIKNNNDEISLLSYEVERSFTINEELLTWVDEAALANNDEEFTRLLDLAIDRYSVTENMANDIILYTNKNILRYDSVVLMSNNISSMYEVDSILNNQMNEIFDQIISDIDSLTINIDEIISVNYILPIGTTTIELESLDSLDGLSSCTFDVTVFDDKAPKWMEPDSLEIFVTSDSSFCGVIVDYGFPIIHEICLATVELIEGLGSGSLYPIGATVDVYQATDVSGNTSTYDVNIIVQDKGLPKFDNYSDTLTYFTTPNSCLGEVTLPSFSATDNCSLNPTILCGQPPGQIWNGGSSPFSSDEYWFSAIAEDDSGNQNIWESLVRVIDNQNPLMMCKDITIAIETNDTTYISAMDIDNGSFDNCQIVTLSVFPSVFTSNEIGANTVTMRAIDTYGNISTCQATVNINSNSTSLYSKIFLGGSAPDPNIGLMNDNLPNPNVVNSSNTDLMRDDLRTLSDFPLISPYGTDESIALPVLAVVGSDAIVDWVKIELRDPTNPTLVIATRSALLQRDGDIVDLDGISAVALAYSGNAYIVIDHRNHLGIMSATPVMLSGSASYDFTTAQHQAYGTNAMMDMGGVYGMIGGDANGSNSISAADRADVWNNRNASGYHDHDANLNGGTTAADRAMTWNNRNLQSQIPI